MTAKNPNNSLKLVFAGSGPYADPIFESLVKSFNNLTLITKKNEPLGQSVKTTKPTVKILAKSRNIPTFEISDKSDLLKAIQKIKPDLVVISSLGVIITEEALKIPKHGFINIHYSLLPAYRGTSPVQSAILNGDKRTGFVIQKVVKGVDEGDILFQQSIILDGSENSVTLRNKLLNLATQKIEKVIIDDIQGKITPKKQDHSRATYSKILSKTDGKINWNKTAEIIKREIRAYNPWPGTYTFWGGKILKILEAEVLEENSKEKPGTFLKVNQGYSIQTGKNLLAVKKLQLEGKKAMTTEEFIRGYRNIVGSILG